MITVIKQLIKTYIFPDSVTSHAIQIYLIQFFTVICGLIGGIVIARTMGPAEKGTFDLFKTLSSFVNEIGALGIGYGFLFYLANKNVPIEKVHGSMISFSLIAGALISILGFTGLPLWRYIFPGLPDWIILLPFLLTFVTLYVYLYPFMMTGINKAVESYKIWLSISIITLLVSVYLWRFHILNPKTIIWATAIIGMVNAGITFFYIIRKYPKLKPDFPLIKNSLGYGVILFIGALANIVHYKIDQVMVNFWLGPASVGIYNVSVNWAERLFLLDGALLSAALYKISSSPSDESIQLTNKVFRTQLIISGIGGIILAAIAYPLIVILYGEAYKDAVIPLILLIPGIFAWSIMKVHSNMLTYNRGLGSYVTKIAISGSIFNIILNIIVLEFLHSNIVGVSITSSLSYIFVAIVIYRKSLSLTKKP